MEGGGGVVVQVFYKAEAGIAEEEELKNRVTSSLFVEQKWKAL